MNYYKDANNQVFAYSDEQLTHPVVIEKLKELTEITKEEAKAITHPPLTLEQLAVTKNREITDSFNKDVSSITTALPHEMISWRKQEDEARAHTADNTVSTPFIDAQLITRDLGETKDELVAKIIANADAYQVAYAALLGKFQNLSNKIDKAVDITDLDLIVW